MLDDEAFARAWVESRDRARPRGERAIREELRLKGVDRASIDLVLAERRDAAPTEGEHEGDGDGAIAGSDRRGAAARQEPPQPGSGRRPSPAPAARLCPAGAPRVRSRGLPRGRGEVVDQDAGRTRNSTRAVTSATRGTRRPRRRR